MVTHKNKQNSINGEMEKILVVWKEDQINYNIPLNQNLIKSKAIILFHSMKPKGGESYHFLLKWQISIYKICILIINI